MEVIVVKQSINSVMSRSVEERSLKFTVIMALVACVRRSHSKWIARSLLDNVWAHRAATSFDNLFDRGVQLHCRYWIQKLWRTEDSCATTSLYQNVERWRSCHERTRQNLVFQSDANMLSIDVITRELFVQQNITTTANKEQDVDHRRRKLRFERLLSSVFRKIIVSHRD